ncbi:MAG: hypothetical protein KC620_06630 [Myxococcales bacterium]|nr:hypothetical protein [Myxococcales bacterium]
MRRALGLLLVLGALMPATAGAADVEAARQAFWKGDFAAAAAGFREVVGEHPDAADVWYALGTAEARAGRGGPAVHALEQALLLDPDDADAAFNLAQVREGIVAKALRENREGRAVLPGEDDLGIGLLTLVAPRTLGLLFAVGWLAMFLALHFMRTARAAGRRTAFAFVSVIAGLLALAAGGLLIARAAAVDTATEGVVLPDRVRAHQGPGEQYPANADVLGGVKVRLGGTDSGWRQVTLPDGAGAWLPEADVAALHRP